MANSVTVMCPNKHRVVLRITPVKILQEILEEACKKQGFSPDGKGLSHHNKTLDLAQSFRLSGLPNNCTLEVMEQKASLPQGPAPVQVALQLPNGSRSTVSIMSDSTLLDLLNEAETGGAKDLTCPQGENLHPVLQYMTQQFQGPLVLATTTLKSMGIVGGRVLVRYSAKEIEPGKMREINSAVEESQENQKRLDEVFAKKKRENEERERFEEERRKHWEADRLKREEAEERKANAAQATMEEERGAAGTSNSTPLPLLQPSASRMERLEHILGVVDQSLHDHTDVPWNLEDTQGRIPMDSVVGVTNGTPLACAMEVDGAEFADFKFPEETKGRDLRGEAKTSSREVPPCERHPLVYRVGGGGGGRGGGGGEGEELPEDFFTVTSQDVQKMQRMLKEESNALVNKALISDSVIRQRNEERKQRAWRYTVIRVLFPDKTVLQATFYSLEKGVPPNFQLEKKRGENLIRAGLAPAATVVFGVRGTPRSERLEFLKHELLSQAKTQMEASDNAQESLSKNGVYSSYEPVIVGGQTEQAKAQTSAGYSAIERGAGGSGGASGSGSGGSVPKWLKGGKK